MSEAFADHSLTIGDVERVELFALADESLEARVGDLRAVGQHDLFEMLTVARQSVDGRVQNIHFAGRR